MMSEKSDLPVRDPGASGAGLPELVPSPPPQVQMVDVHADKEK
jgi:hypothetical protein